MKPNDTNDKSERKISMTYFAAVLLLLIVCCLSAVYFFIVKNGAKKIEAADIYLSQHIYDEVMSDFNAAIYVADAMAGDAFLQSFLQNEGDYKKDEEAMKSYLSLLRDTFGLLQATCVSAATYRYYRDTRIHKIINPENDPHDTWFRQFEKTPLKHYIGVYISKKDASDSQVYVNARIESEDGRLLGVSSPVVRLNDVIKHLDALEAQYGVKINLTDENGIVMLSSEYDEIETANLSHLLPRTKDWHWTRRGLSDFCATAYIEDMDWYFILQGTDGVQTFQYFYLAAAVLTAAGILLLFMARRASHDKEVSFVASKEQIDALTKLPNRNYFKDIYGERGVFNTTRYKCIAVFDIDFFKEANDNLNGNDALLSVVREMNSLLGGKGLLFRWGGDEFVVLFEQPLDSAYEICKTFCKRIEDEGMITVSVGLSAIKLSDTIKTNYHRAARYCYTAKELGGNGVKKD